MTVKEIADRLHIDPKVLEEESLRLYINQKLRLVEAEIFKIAQKHGVKNVEEFDQKIKDGKIPEQESWEDFFEMDNLEAERDDLIETLKEL